MALHPTLSKDAVEETEEEKKKKKKKEKTTLLAGVGSTLAGPIGGALIGVGAGAVDANREDKATDPNRPKRRRLTKALAAKKERKQTQQTALATLSQAVFDWASSVR